MITLAVILIAWAILKKVQQKNITQTETYIPVAEIQRSQKEREKAEQAASDYDRLTAQRETVLALCEAIERELTTCTTDKHRTQLLSKLATTENRLASIDRRREKTFSAAYAA